MGKENLKHSTTGLFRKGLVVLSRQVRAVRNYLVIKCQVIPSVDHITWIIYIYIYLTIIPLALVGYEMLDMRCYIITQVILAI